MYSVKSTTNQPLAFAIHCVNCWAMNFLTSNQGLVHYLTLFMSTPLYEVHCLSSYTLSAYKDEKRKKKIGQRQLILQTHYYTEFCRGEIR